MTNWSIFSSRTSSSTCFHTQISRITSFRLSFTRRTRIRQKVSALFSSMIIISLLRQCKNTRFKLILRIQKSIATHMLQPGKRTWKAYSAVHFQGPITSSLRSHLLGKSSLVNPRVDQRSKLCWTMSIVRVAKGDGRVRMTWLF